MVVGPCVDIVLQVHYDAAQTCNDGAIGWPLLAHLAWQRPEQDCGKFDCKSNCLFDSCIKEIL